MDFLGSMLGGGGGGSTSKEFGRSEASVNLSDNSTRGAAGGSESNWIPLVIVAFLFLAGVLALIKSK